MREKTVLLRKELPLYSPLVLKMLYILFFEPKEGAGDIVGGNFVMMNYVPKLFFADFEEMSGLVDIEILFFQVFVVFFLLNIHK